MKPVHIVILVILGVAVAIILTVFGSASTYVTFRVAEEMATDGNNQSIHVVGEVKKDTQGNIVDLNYAPTATPIQLSFNMIDDEGREERVTFFDKPKPAELEHAEKIVIIGHFENDHFLGEDILLKCPSKYENKELKEATAAIGQ